MEQVTQTQTNLQIGADFAVQVMKWMTGGTGSWWEALVKLATIGVAGLGAWLLYRWAKNAEAKAIHDKTEQDRAKDEANADEENKKTEQDASDAENEVKKK